MPGCAVKFCPNWNGNTKHKGTKYFRFPKDPQLVSQWLKACGKHSVNLKHARVCSDHFSTDCIVQKPFHLIVPGDKDIDIWKLVKTAVPTRNLQLASKQLNTPKNRKNVMLDYIQNHYSESYYDKYIDYLRSPIKFLEKALQNRAKR